MFFVDRWQIPNIWTESFISLCHFVNAPFWMIHAARIAGTWVRVFFIWNFCVMKKSVGVSLEINLKRKGSELSFVKLCNNSSPKKCYRGFTKSWIIEISSRWDSPRVDNEQERAFKYSIFRTRRRAISSLALTNGTFVYTPLFTPNLLKCIGEEQKT